MKIFEKTAASGNPKVVAFLPARVSSSRLPKKHLKRIGKHTMLEWVAKRAQESAYIEEVMLCMPDEPGIEELSQHGESIGLTPAVWRGEVDDVVGRLACVAAFSGAEICVMLSGDCPLLCGERVDSLIEALIDNPDRKLACFAEMPEKYHLMLGCRVERASLWNLANELSVKPYDREHQFPILNPEREEIPDKAEIFVRGIKKDYFPFIYDVSVDTPHDLQTTNSIYEILKKKGVSFNLSNVRDLLRTMAPACQEI
jgi:spore coat polysaccharide biosynthesis protein SpsF